MFYYQSPFAKHVIKVHLQIVFLIRCLLLLNAHNFPDSPTQVKNIPRFRTFCSESRRVFGRFPVGIMF